MRRLKPVSVALLLTVAVIAGFEFLGQRVVFKDRLYFINDVDHRMGPKCAPDINSDGIRSTVEADSFADGDLNIVFLGDSYVYGLGLPYDQTIPYTLQSIARTRHPELHVNVANFGWSSSSPLLSLRLLKDIGGKYNPDIVILAVDMTDFQDDMKYSRLLERRGIYRAIGVIPVTIMVFRRAVSRLGPLHEAIFGFPGRRFFITDMPLSRSRPYFTCIQSSIDSIAAFTQDELGARFVLLVFPRSYQYSDRECPDNWERSEYEVLGPYSQEPFKYFEALQGHVDYPVHSLLPDFRDSGIFPTCFHNDPHWNRNGARVAAEAAYRYCREDGCFE